MTLSSTVCRIAAACAIIVLAPAGCRHTHHVGRLIDGCDSDGYSRMAVAIRQGRKDKRPAGCTVHDEQTRQLIGHLKATHLPAAVWGQAVAASAAGLLDPAGSVRDAPSLRLVAPDSH